MLSKLYHALLGAGVDDATATAAAEEAAQSDQRFAAIDVKLVEIHGELERRFAQVDTRFAVLEGQLGRTLDAVKALGERLDSHFRIVYWILGIMGAAILGIIWRVVS
jgi:hypothetical protein